MTVAIGIISPNCLVVAADSQEGWSSGETKPAAKILVGILNGPKDLRGRIVITGAGGTDYLAYLKTRIIDRVRNLRPSEKSFHRSIEAAISAEMVDFFSVHFLPLAAVLDNHRNEEPELIVAAHMRAHGGPMTSGLWATHGSSVRRIHGGGEAVGAGMLHARRVLEASQPNYAANEHAATVTASYAVYSAKERSESCGQETVVVSLGRSADDMMARASATAIRRAEDAFRKYDDLQRNMLDAITISTKATWSFDADTRLTAIQNELRVINFYPHEAR